MNIDNVNKWLTAVQSVCVIIGVIIAVKQLSDVRTQIAQSHQIAGADFVMRLRANLDEKSSESIAKAIHDVTAIMSATGIIVCESKMPIMADARTDTPICKKPSMADALPMLWSKGTRLSAAALE